MSAAAAHGVALAQPSDLREELDRGTGWAVVKGFTVSGPLEEVSRRFEHFSHQFGPVSRHGQSGTTIWKITPRQDIEHLPTFSETASEAPLHTDNSWAPHPEKYMALLVVRPADKGGDSIVFSVDEALETFGRSLVGRRAICLMRQLNYPFATPDVFETNMSKRAVTIAPIIDPSRGFRFRYDVIQAGFELLPRLATAEALWAVEVFNHFLNSWVERKANKIHLETGDILISNNHRALHARTPFTDCSRLLLRARMA
ncbi:MAG: TauD/TfdA family dioxygenase [Deltaproteobacteria bacterium]|nr:TauD/TfdA family dioxygenase [Deltaproteobacteria bacterium]MBI3293565.1 TauD/TfdA family dioxygenase [Deltaproteobacteria bacterium]